jgi:hypothetical protein
MGITFVAVLCAVLAAESPGADPDSLARQTAIPEDERAQGAAGVAPIELIPRIEVRHAFAQFTNGVTASTTTAQMDLTLGRRLLFRYELPHRRVESAGMEASGLGDIQLQAVGVLTAGPRQVSALIAGLVLDTATAAPLGAGKQQVFFGAAAAVKPRPWWLPYLLVQEQISFAGDEARPDVNQLFVRAGNIVFGRYWDWYKLDLDTTVDFKSDAARLFGTLEAGSLAIGRVGLFVRAGTQLAGQREIDYTVQGGVRYLFKLEKRPAEASGDPAPASHRASAPR